MEDFEQDTDVLRADFRIRMLVPVVGEVGREGWGRGSNHIAAAITRAVGN